MKLLSTICTLAGFLALLEPARAYTNPITIKNYKMYDAKTGEYFGVKGVDYYPRPNAGELNENNLDLFTDDYEAIWTPDLAQLAALGANAVRLYAVDPSKSHSKFMCALRSYGMYALVDIGASCEGCSITKDKYPACYSSTLKTRGQQIIDEFAQYDNVLAFSAGNEINHVADAVTDNAPCQKKFIRDMRAYIASCSTLRQIPVGVVLADSADQRELNAKYYNCRTNSSDEYENAQWYGLNVYQYCDGTVTSVDKAEGYQGLLSDFQAYQMNIPVLFTEFGCLDKSFPTVDGYAAQRTWLQAGWIHSKTFREQFNGGFAFEYSTELANSKEDSPYPFTTYGAQNYGLGYYSPEDCDHVNTTCTYKRMPNYNYLAKQYNATDYSDEPAMSSFVANTSKIEFPSCPSSFKKLSDITWSDVDAVSLSCPTSAQAYTCPGQSSSGTWTGTSKSTTGGTSGTSGTSGDSTTSGTRSTRANLISAALVAVLSAVAPSVL